MLNEPGKKLRRGAIAVVVLFVIAELSKLRHSGHTAAPDGKAIEKALVGVGLMLGTLTFAACVLAGWLSRRKRGGRRYERALARQLAARATFSVVAAGVALTFTLTAAVAAGTIPAAAMWVLAGAAALTLLGGGLFAAAAIVDRLSPTPAPAPEPEPSRPQPAPQQPRPARPTERIRYVPVIMREVVVEKPAPQPAPPQPAPATAPVARLEDVERDEQPARAAVGSDGE